MEPWTIALAGVAADGNVTQLYPALCTAGTDPASATHGQLIRRTNAGTLYKLQIKTDGTNAGTLELYDISGIELGIDTSSATTITDAQLDTAISAGNARLIYSQNYVATGVTPGDLGPISFLKGLAARNVASGTITLNMSVKGGYEKVEKLAP
jgi:hypothetical protein